MIVNLVMVAGPEFGKNTFFLDDPASSGKTCVTELMIHALRF